MHFLTFMPSFLLLFGTMIECWRNVSQIHTANILLGDIISHPRDLFLQCTQHLVEMSKAMEEQRVSTPEILSQSHMADLSQLIRKHHTNNHNTSNSRISSSHINNKKLEAKSMVTVAQNTANIPHSNLKPHPLKELLVSNRTNLLLSMLRKHPSTPSLLQPNNSKALH